MLATIAGHRIITTPQLRTLLRRHPSPLCRDLATLVSAKAIDSLPIGAGRTLAWFPTDVAARRHAHGQNRGHTLAVNEAGIAFVEAARRLGHDCGPLDWTHEVRLGKVTADAVLRYDNGESMAVRFLELDRGTESVDILRLKVKSYCLMVTDGTWREQFVILPKLIVIFAMDERAASRRMERLGELCRIDPVIVDSDLVVSMTTLERLRSPGPWSPVFVTPAGAMVDFAGRAP